MDHHSKVGNKSNHWHSFLKRGRLVVDDQLTKAEVKWDEAGEGIELYSQISAGGRGMELSDLVFFDGHLLTVDE